MNFYFSLKLRESFIYTNKSKHILHIANGEYLIWRALFFMVNIHCGEAACSVPIYYIFSMIMMCKAYCLG